MKIKIGDYKIETDNKQFVVKSTTSNKAIEGKEV